MPLDQTFSATDPQNPFAAFVAKPQPEYLASDPQNPFAAFVPKPATTEAPPPTVRVDQSEAAPATPSEAPPPALDAATFPGGASKPAAPMPTPSLIGSFERTRQFAGFDPNQPAIV